MLSIYLLMSFDAQNFWDFCWDWVYDTWVLLVLYVVAMFAWFLFMPFVVIFVSLSFLCLMERRKSRKFIFIENGKWHLRFGVVVTCFLWLFFLDWWLGSLMILVWVVIWVSFVFDLYLWSGSMFVFDLCFFFFSFFRLCCCDLGLCWSLLVIWVCVCV